MPPKRKPQLKRTSYPSDLGVRLRDLREALGWDQGRMAKEVDRTVSQVSRWENGHAQPHVGALLALCERYGWPREIFTRGGPMPSTVRPPLTAALTAQGETSGDLAGVTSGVHTDRGSTGVVRERLLGYLDRAEQEAGGEPEGAGWMFGDPSLAQERIEGMLRDIEHSVRTSSTGLTPHGLLQLRAAVLDDLVFQCREAARPVPQWLALMAYDAAKQLR